MNFYSIDSKGDFWRENLDQFAQFLLTTFLHKIKEVSFLIFPTKNFWTLPRAKNSRLITNFPLYFKKFSRWNFNFPFSKIKSNITLKNVSLPDSNFFAEIMFPALKYREATQRVIAFPMKFFNGRETLSFPHLNVFFSYLTANSELKTFHVASDRKNNFFYCRLLFVTQVKWNLSAQKSFYVTLIYLHGKLFYWMFTL